MPSGLNATPLTDCPGSAEGAEVEVALAPGVIPLPAPEVLGAAVEQLQGPGDVVAQALAQGEVDPVDVVPPPQFLRPLVRLGLGTGLVLGQGQAFARSVRATVSDRLISP